MQWELESNIRFQSLCVDVIASDLNNGCFLLSVRLYTYQSGETISVQSICMRACQCVCLLGSPAHDTGELVVSVSPPQAECNSSSTVETTVRWWKRGISVSRQATHLMAQYVITQMIALQWSLPRRAEQKGSSCSACSDLSWRPAWLFPTRRRHCVVSLPLDDGTFLHLVPPKPLHVLEIQY